MTHEMGKVVAVSDLGGQGLLAQGKAGHIMPLALMGTTGTKVEDDLRASETRYRRLFESVILSYTQFAMQALREGDPLKDDLLDVKRAGERAAALTLQQRGTRRGIRGTPRRREARALRTACSPTVSASMSATRGISSARSTGTRW